MPKIFLTSDQHWGHANFLAFKDEQGRLIRPFACVEDIDLIMIDRWNKVVGKHDKVYHLGDVCFSLSVLERVMPQLNGVKVLIKGNHDQLKLSQYAMHFKDVRASHRLDGMILTHIPIHPYLLDRAKANIHGHTHQNIVMNGDAPDQRYVNVCVEVRDYTPVDFEQIRQSVKHDQ